MIGAIAGDIVGSIYEFNNIKTKDFELFSAESIFTDDSVLTMATMEAILNNKPYNKAYKDWFNKFPNAGYGKNFVEWASSSSMEPYNSWGNGSAMRVSPIGFYFDSLEKVLEEAKKSAEVTHNHPEGIKGAQATAASIFLARIGEPKDKIKRYIQHTFNYDLSEALDSIRKWYRFDISCQGSVPQAIIAFLRSGDYEDSVRNAVSFGGDSDTIACITGAISEAYYKKVPNSIEKEVLKRVPQEFKDLIQKFYTSLGYANLYEIL